MQKINSIFFFVWILLPFNMVHLTVPAFGQQKEYESKRPKVAVVLSGGGAKGFAHIGALKILEEEGIPIDIIVGTSMGSLIGGFYSLGYYNLQTNLRILNEI